MAWERSLGSLLESRPAVAASQPGETPLAIELTLQSCSHSVIDSGNVFGASLDDDDIRGLFA